MIDEEPDSIDADFYLAIDRILQRIPRDPDLVAKLKAGKQLRLNPLNVAKEAGHSRSTIYKRTKVLERIVEIGKKPRDLLKTRIECLEKENKILIENRNRALDTAAAAIMRMRKLEQGSKKAQRRADREASRPNSNMVVGNVVELRPNNGRKE